MQGTATFLAGAWLFALLLILLWVVVNVWRNLDADADWNAPPFYDVFGGDADEHGRRPADTSLGRAVVGGVIVENDPALRFGRFRVFSYRNALLLGSFAVSSLQLAALAADHQAACDGAAPLARRSLAPTRTSACPQVRCFAG